ncbi:hypothetical protein M2103_000233 [Ereboglobus sp. PH5-5]|nr:BACON domain-containing carbohydrate-binding protein [Ereboglobus sp. PH5-5]MDF9832029.1 hypothetical protein [Ereboglobus sp. PH5-5]
MIAFKKPAVRKIFLIGTTVLLVTGVAFIFHSRKARQISPQTAKQPVGVTAPQSVADRHNPQTDTATLIAPVSAGTIAANHDQHHRRRTDVRASLATQPSGANASAPAGSNDAAGTDALTQKQRAILETIPSARFRDELLSLAPDARTFAFKTLAANRIPAADFASLHLTPKGHLYYACRFVAGNHSGGATAETSTSGALDPVVAAAAVPINQPPVRHSRPGSTKVLFLDFGGGLIENTAWNKSYEVNLYRALPYNIDGDSTTFNEQEQDNIVKIWERVSEYFSAFDVDVTTEKPAVFTRTTGRVLITRSNDANGRKMPAAADGADGVAIFQRFGWLGYETDYSPAFIYYDKLNSINADIAYATAHEFGHNLGLSHDGPGYQTNSDDFGYYPGHGAGATSWGTIMGNAYNTNRRNVYQWSKGEYYSANNKEDDLMIIEGKFGYRGIIAATTRAAALPLTTGDDGILGASGLIRNADEPHYYGINLSAPGTIDFSLYPARVSGTGTIIGSTDLKLEILDSSGNLNSSNDSPTLTHATLSRQLTAGQWYLRITSGSTGNPHANSISSRTGYTAYGSIGQYTLTSNLVQSNPSLAAALAGELTWTKEPGADTEWFGQTTTTHDGVAAAQSGTLAQGQSSGVLTTVEGSGTLSFWWKISADAADTLVFATTDLSTALTETPACITGQLGWEKKIIPIPTTGTHQFGWTFDKASAGTTGAAWVDQVVWTPDNFNPVIAPSTKEADSGSGHFTLTATTSKTWTATTDDSWLGVTPASGNAGSQTLTITHDANDTGSPRRATVTITSGGISRVCEVAQPAHIPLATALDNNLVWTTGGSNIWRSQTITTHDGRHAARSGIILGTSSTNVNIGQNTWLQTTVTGPGIVSFWWKVSSEAEERDEDGDPWGDILYFKVNGEERARISGEKDWARRAVPITGTGAQTLTWLYQKDPYLDIGGDAAWLDQVVWTTGTDITLSISPGTKQVSASRNTFPVTADTDVEWAASTSVSWLTVSPATGVATGSFIVTCATNSSPNPRTGIITVTAGNRTATCTVTQQGATNTGSNDNDNSGGGGGGGGAPSLWSLALIGMLFGIRKIVRMRARGTR